MTGNSESPDLIDLGVHDKELLETQIPKSVISVRKISVNTHQIQILVEGSARVRNL
jgi:hypothetical protein